VSSSRSQADAARLAALVAGTEAWGEQAAALTQVIRAVIAAEIRGAGGDPAVDDLTQEVIRRALEGRDRVRADAPLRPWVIGIARHVAADERRRRQRLRLDDHADEADSAAGCDVPGASRPDDLACRAQGLERLRSALAQLPEAWREALVLFHVEDLSYQQISHRLRVPMGTVATWISRGRRQLLSLMTEEEKP
jgi:RNA polymerase sigma-70 factor, ECF subfamily